MIIDKIFKINKLILLVCMLKTIMLRINKDRGRTNMAKINYIMTKIEFKNLKNLQIDIICNAIG